MSAAPHGRVTSTYLQLSRLTSHSTWNSSRFKVTHGSCRAFTWWLAAVCRAAAASWARARARGRARRQAGRGWRRRRGFPARWWRRWWRAAGAPGSAWWRRRRWAARPPPCRSRAASAALSPRPASISRGWGRQSATERDCYATWNCNGKRHTDIDAGRYLIIVASQLHHVKLHEDNDVRKPSFVFSTVYIGFSLLLLTTFLN